MDIQEVRREYSDGNQFWAAEAIGELENVSTGGSLRWALASAQHLVDVDRPLNHELLSTLLRDLASSEDREEAGEWITKAERIEHRYDDNISLAIAHLLCARASALKGELLRYRTHLVKAMMFLGRHPYAERTCLSHSLQLLEQALN